MIEKKLALLILAWFAVFTGSWTQSAEAEQIQIITELGNVFSVEDENTADSTTTAAADSISIIGGTGATIRVVEPQGKVIHGRGTSGEESSLVPYVDVSGSNNFAAVIQKDDRQVSMKVPEFAKEYRYDKKKETLTEIKRTIPNILSYSDSKVISGTGKVTNGEDGITLEGPEKYVHKHNTRLWWKKISHMHNADDIIAVKLDKSLGGQKTLLRGTVPGEYVSFAESPYSLLELPYSKDKGFQIDETSSKKDHTVKKIKRQSGGRGWCCIYWTDIVTDSVFTINKLASSKSNVEAIYDYTKLYETCHKHRGYRSYYCHWHTHSSSGSANLSIDGQKEGDYYKITTATFRHTDSSTQKNVRYNGVLRVYDSGLPISDIMRFTSDFEKLYTFPKGKTVYMVAQADGKIKVEAEKFDPNFGVWFTVKGIPPDTPYQLEKNGFVGARGISPSNANSDLILTASAVDVGGQNTPGGTLKIYPDSMRYRGPFSTIVFDTINKQIIRIDDSAANERVYTPFAYIRIPFATPTSIENVSIDGITPLGYLAKEYSAGDAVDIPVLPGMKKVVLRANGVDNVLNLHDIAGKVGAKAIPPKVSSNTKYSASGAVSSINSDAAGGAFAVATGSGQMYAMITLSVSGDSAFSNDVTLYFVPDPPPPPVPRDPLSVYVDVYKNGKLVKSEKIYYDDKPVFEPVSELNGLKLKQAITYHYNQRTATVMVLVDVEPGDMVEFYARSHIHADGIPVQIPTASGGKYLVEEVVSAASATSRIHSGSILTGMS